MTDARRVAVRVRFIDGGGAPVSGIIVRFSTIPETRKRSDGGSPTPEPLVNEIAAVQTDAAGYCSIKVEPAALAGASGVTATYGGAEGAVRNWTLAQLASTTLQTITVAPSDTPTIAPHLGLPSILLADVLDATISPGSIGTIPQQLPGSGICSQLTPTNPRIRRFSAFTVHADICQTSSVTCSETVEFARGSMLEYEIAWHPLGASLGDLLNTITLAPCEQVNIAVVDWMRRETATQSQSIDITQQLQQTMNRDRLITESMHSSILTIGAAEGGAIGAKAPITDKIDLTASFGAAGSVGFQQAAVNTTNQLSEKISQSASFVSSERSTVVFQATASEQQTYQTRTIRNNNHCHTLTMEYYQVNENYRVETAYAGTRDVVLIKYDNADFDAKRAYCNAEALKPALLDQNLLSCFDKLADALYCCALTPVAPPPGHLIETITITFWVEALLNPWNLTGYVNVASGPATPIYIATGQWQVGEMHQATVTLTTPVAASDLVSVVLTSYGGSVNWVPLPSSITFSKIEIACQAGANATPTIFSSQTMATVEQGTSWLTWLSASAASNPPSLKNECVEKSCDIQKLLGHINCHKRYYNGLLWLNEDPNERVMRWSCCGGKDGLSLSLVGQIENNPITIYGDFVVFAAAGSQLVPDPTVDPVKTLITMPTPGVFSEGILGQCNTCEAIDADRFWDWKSSPCPDNAPVITPTLTPQAGATPGTMKADTIANLITLTAVPDAGQSALKDIVASLVSEADSGSKAAQDMLGKLLDSLKSSVTETPAKPASGG